MQVMPNKKTINRHTSESAERIFQTLSSEPVAVLATTKDSGAPHAAAVYFSVDEDFNLYFVTKKGTQKYKELQRDPRVCMVVYELTSQTSVQVSGVAEEENDVTAANKAFDNMLRAAENTSGSGIPPITKLHAGYYVAYKVKPSFISMVVFARPDPGGYEMYERLNFA